MESKSIRVVIDVEEVARDDDPVRIQDNRRALAARDADIAYCKQAGFYPKKMTSREGRLESDLGALRLSLASQATRVSNHIKYEEDYNRKLRDVIALETYAVRLLKKEIMLLERISSHWGIDLDEEISLRREFLLKQESALSQIVSLDAEVSLEPEAMREISSDRVVSLQDVRDLQSAIAVKKVQALAVAVMISKEAHLHEIEDVQNRIRVRENADFLRGLISLDLKFEDTETCTVTAVFSREEDKFTVSTAWAMEAV